MLFGNTMQVDIEMELIDNVGKLGIDKKYLKKTTPNHGKGKIKGRKTNQEKRNMNGGAEGQSKQLGY